jgi:hypothetical protein
VTVRIQKFACFRWFDYMGNEADSDFVPFQINYTITSESDGVHYPLTIETKSCAEPYDVSFHLM